LPSRARALDLGCGTGRNAIALARSGCDVFAVDLSRTAVLQSKKIADDGGVGLHLWQGDVRNMALAGYFDLVLAYSILNSLAKPHWPPTISWMQDLTNC